MAVTTCGRRHHIKKGTGLLVGESEDDIRDNVFNYDEQGGGEEDEVRLHGSQVKRGLNDSHVEMDAVCMVWVRNCGSRIFMNGCG